MRLPRFARNDRAAIKGSEYLIPSTQVKVTGRGKTDRLFAYGGYAGIAPRRRPSPFGARRRRSRQNGSAVCLRLICRASRVAAPVWGASSSSGFSAAEMRGGACVWTRARARRAHGHLRARLETCMPTSVGHAPRRRWRAPSPLRECSGILAIVAYKSS